MNEAPTVIVLAAGEGKRMRSSLPKMMHPLLGRTLIGHVLHAASPLRAARTLVVIGHGADQVGPHVAEIAPAATTVLQAEQHGTGHAVRIALDAAPDVAGTVLVINGDTPLLRTETLTRVLASHASAGAGATVLTARVEDPSGLGRIVRDSDGRVQRIVEQRDASAAEAAITEVNTGLYAFQADALRDALGKISSDNAQGEEYLTDVIGLLIAAGHGVEAVVADDANETLGCNDRAQLADLRNLLRDRVNGEIMRSGVTMMDPATTWVDVTVTVGVDATIEPNTQLRGATVIEAGALVGPDTTLTDVTVGEGAHVVRTHGSNANIGAGASVGPFAYLRPGTELGDSAKIGTFVETKNARIGRSSKVPHLSYVGDATIGEHANIGAATIFVNYDGVHKHHTTIGDGAFVGCDTSLIAPATVGDGAYIAAGSAISGTVAPGVLAVTRAPLRTIDGWVARKRAGTKSAAAAARAIQAAAEAASAADTSGDGTAE